jgi:hypothetical protein
LHLGCKDQRPSYTRQALDVHFATAGDSALHCIGEQLALTSHAQAPSSMRTGADSKYMLGARLRYMIPRLREEPGDCDSQLLGGTDDPQHSLTSRQQKPDAFVRHP